MKPISIKISAFGPYRDLTTIDFEKIGNSGIFLISGVTGSGKTSIFDAISFALYNEVSGSNKLINSLRSDFATDEDTFVEFIFVHKGIKYKVYRSLSYERPKKKGEGTTKKLAEAYLWINYDNKQDDTPVSGISVVNEKIEEILGMNVKQFKQISMLAQGEFLKILFAKSEDRTEIYRRIFDTNLYNLFSTLLQEKAKDARTELSQLKTAFYTNYENIYWPDEEKSNIKYEEINRYDVEDVIEELQVVTKNQKKECKELKKAIEDEEKELNNNTKEYNEKIIFNSYIKNYRSMIASYNELQNQKIHIEEVKEEIKKGEYALLYINPIYDGIKENSLNINNLKKELHSINENISSSKKELDDSAIVEKNLETIKNIINDYNEYTLKLIEMNLIVDKIQRILEGQKNKEKIAKEYNEKNNKYIELNKEYLIAEDVFFKEQAGIIAEKLVDGNPCPVCGSIEHPNKACKSNNVLTKEQLNSLKEEKELLEKKINKLKSDIISIDTANNVLIKQIPESNTENFDVKQFKDKITVEYNNLKNDISSTEAEFNKTYKSISKSSKSISIKSFDVDKFNKELQANTSKIRENLAKNVANSERIEKEIQVKSDSINSLQSELSKLLEDNQINIEDIESQRYTKKSVDANRKLVVEYDNSITSINSKLEIIEKDLNQFLSNIVKDLYKDTKVNDFKNYYCDNDYINSLKEEDTFEFKKQLDRTTASIKTMRDKYTKKSSQYDNNVRLLKAIKDISIRFNESVDSVTRLDELSKLSLGTYQKGKKVTFEQYVQATYFDMILIEANKRLIEMTDGRFELIRKKTATKSEKFGLDLDVLDNYSGKIRDVKSLSGGESFKASLSLALGLSDVIQMHSGGVVIDTIFIDEGFGSLDNESREQAINTLIKLAGKDKLIGIISHVSELKERIDKQIIVEKDVNGSKIRI